jgi:GntR family transcriptional repressor for pyruvate dehydrogenase complex
MTPAAASSSALPTAAAAPTAFTAVPKTRLSAAVVQQVQALIRDGTLQEGQRLPAERELAATLGVSRMSVREALRLLEVMGHLHTDAGRGTFVCRLPEPAPRPASRAGLDLLEDGALFDQLATVREAIEPKIAALAARHATESEVARLYDLHAAVARQIEAGDLAAFTRADLALHNAIADAARNRIFSHILDDLQGLLLEMRQISVADLSSPRARAAHREHAAVVDAIARHDEDGAARTMVAHFVAQRRAYTRVAASRPRK